MRVVIDTNVAVSALLLPRSVPRQAFDRALEHNTVLISSATVAELNDVLRRPHFDKYVHEAIPSPIWILDYFRQKCVCASPIKSTG